LLLAAAALLAALIPAPPAFASPIPPITIPPGDGVILSGAQAGGCDNVTYGYEIGAAANQVLDSKPAAGCPTSSLSGRAVPAASSAQSLRIWLADTTCVTTLASAPTYFSDGTSTGTSPSVDHALVSGGGPYVVTINDAGGACPGTVQNTNAIPTGPGQGNFHVTITTAPPPTVTVTAPSPTSGRNGYFNAADLAAAGGAVTLKVSAKDSSTTGIRSVACTDDGSPIAVSNQSGTATMTGTVNVSSDGTHNVACTAADNNNENGDTGSANTATVAIDTTSPVISLPTTPLSVQGTSTGATVSSYGASASDPGAGDTPTLACQPAAPHTFPVGNTTVTCTATDRAGNTATRTFTVTVLPPPRSGATSTAVACSPGTLTAALTTTCTVTVSNGAGTAGPLPTGIVHFASTTGAFPGGADCDLAVVGVSASCSVSFRATALGTSAITAAYDGDATHETSGALTTVASAPVAGHTANVRLNGARVLIKVGDVFEPLVGSTVSVPIGATLNVLKGQITIVTAPTNGGGTNQSATISAGMFTVKQQQTQQGLATSLVLDTPPHAVAAAGCTRRHPPAKGIVRQLHGVTKGLYEAVGAASTTTVQGTASWTVQDQCGGTLTKIAKGHATVTITHGGRRHRTVHLGPGQSAYIQAELFAAKLRSEKHAAHRPRLALS
jgi:HYR domain